MKPLILITNDDGIYSSGLKAAIRGCRELGDVLVVAPHHQQTSMGRAYPRYEDLGVIEETELDLGDGSVAGYAIHSSPGHAAAYGILEVAPKVYGRVPDVVVSGINYGCNLARSITCSGTIGACFEAASQGVPALAMSLETSADVIQTSQATKDNFTYAEGVTTFWMKKILTEGMPAQCEILNVNVPARAISPEEYRLTRLSNQNYYVLKQPPQRDWSVPFTMEFEIEVDVEHEEPDSDILALCRDRITSVTPLGWDLTMKG